MCIIYTHDVCDILSSTQRNIFQIQPSFFSPTIVVTDASHASCEANWDGFTKMDTMASNPKHELVAYSRLEEVIHSIQSPVTQYIICGSSLIVRL